MAAVVAHKNEKEVSKKKEPWRFKLVSGKAHPDHKPPTQIVAEASDEAAANEEKVMDSDHEKAAAIPEWTELPAKEEEKK
jgi:hypothetical protein